VGKKPKPGPTLSDDTVILGCWKRSEDDDAWIVRLFEPTGKARTTTLSIPALGVKTKVKLGRFEIKTLKIDPRRKRVVEVDLVEREMKRKR